MKKPVLTMIALMALTFLKAQTVDDIISKHIDALGGKDKISQITSMYMESSMNVANMTANTKVSIINGKDYKSEADFGGQNMVQVITADKGGWSINPFMGATTATAMPDDEYQLRYDDLFAIDPLANYSVNGGKVELDGQEKVGDINAYKIKYTNKFGKATDYYIDPSTWLILKATTTATIMNQTITANTSFSNYQKIDFGIQVPYQINIDMGQYAIAFNISKVDVNTTIDPSIFDMPK